MKKDFSVIKKALLNVFKKKDYFEYFSTNEMTGWEKWLQIELALQLSKTGESKIEEAFGYHMGVLRPASKLKFKKCFIDITFRVKNAQIKNIGAIELKVTNSQSGLRAALSDLHKISAIRPKSWKFRSVTAILIHPTKEKQTKFTNIKNDLINNKLYACESLSCETMRIPNSKFELIMIGWEKSSNKDMTIYSYKKWIKNVRSIFKNHNVKPVLNSLNSVGK